MGCGASSSMPVDGTHEQSPPTGRTPPVGGAGDTRIPEERQGGGNGDTARSTAQSNGDAAMSGSNAPKDGTGQSGAASAQAAQQIATFTTHVMTDSRGAKVSTVIQNKSKVDTMCKWVDNVLKARVASGGIFANPQDGRTRKAAAAPPQDQVAATSSAGGDTASVSSRHAANSRTEYGSMASNGLMGVSTTAQGASGASQSRGNLTMVAQRGSDEEDPTFSPTRVDAEDAPPPVVEA
jgi:hypothetical protein